MLIEFDPLKNLLNLTKHGLSLTKAVELDWERGWLEPDHRKDYGEQRISALVPLGEDLYFLAFVVRGDARRIITLRRANRRECRRYEQHEETISHPDAD